MNTKKRMRKFKSATIITKFAGWKNPICMIVIAALFFIILGMSAFTAAAPSIDGYELPAFASTTNVATLSGSTGGTTLSNNYTYKVTSSITCSNSNAGGNGLTVASGATVVIYVASGCTLTCTGGAGSGATGGGAGIYIPSNSTLVITGAGTVTATGGKAGNGTAGSTGGNAYLNKSGNEYYGGGVGGAGGAGGGGSGAGIGGKGGTGGSGGAQTGRPEAFTAEGNWYHGYNGNAGNAGGTGTAMGTLYVLGTMKVNATAGATGSGGSGGARGNWANDSGSGWSRWYYAGYGGGGGGGGGGYAASAIGGGGAGGGGGGSGGSGGIDNFKNSQGYDKESSYANGAGGTGGTGSANGSTGVGNRTGHNDSYGGYAGSGGGAGSKGGEGTFYKSSGATVSARSPASTQSTHASAQWSVTFNNQSATSAGTTSTTVTLGTTNSGISVPSRTGYTFGGYYTSTGGGGTQYYNASGTATRVWDLAAATTLYAKWTPITYTVQVDFNGGSPSGSLQSRSENLESAHGFTTTTTLTYDLGYNIWNFQNNSTRTGYLYDGLKMSGGDSTALWGYWSEGQYSAGAIHALSNDTKFAESNGDINVKNLATTQGAIVTFTIQWRPITYTLRVQTNGADGGNMARPGINGASQTYGDLTCTYDVAYNPCHFDALTRTGYLYAGVVMTDGASTALWDYWNTDFGGTGTTVATTPLSNNTVFATADGDLNIKNLATTQGAIVTFTIQWRPITYTLRVQTNGADGGNMARPEINGASQTYGDLTCTYDVAYNPCHFDALTRTGYLYAGVVMTDGASTALWDYWNTDFGGTGTTVATTPLSNNTVFATADGDLNIKNLATTQGATVTFTIQWRPITYSTVYNYAGGTKGSNSPTSWTYDAAQAVSAPTRTGYTFSGWTVTSGLNTTTAKWGTTSSPDTAISSSSTKCVNGATGSVYFKNLTPTNGGSVTLTATWTANTYTVGYNYAGGTNGSSSPTSWTYDAAQAVSAPTRAGYTFAGWTVTSGLNASTAKWGTTSSPSTAISATTTQCGSGASSVYFKNLTPTNGGSVTLTATWTANSYTATYNANGGSVSPTSKSVTFASAYGDLATPTRTGYSFLGWRLIPAEYQQVEYISTNGGGGFVMTDLTPTGKSSMRMVATPNSVTASQNFWCARGANSNTQTFTMFSLPTSLRYDYGNETGSGYGVIAANTKYVLSAEKNRGWLNGTTALSAYSQSEYTAGGPIVFMASYYNGYNYANKTLSNPANYGNMKMYGATVWDSGAVTGYFVPCYRKSDNKIGLYDIINNKFHAGAGTGLSKGGDVYITSATEFAVGKDVTLYAVWKANNYTVGYNYAGGTNGSSSPTSWTYDAAQAVSAPTRTGYTFSGWTVTSGLNTTTAKWGTTSSPDTAISSSSTKCVNGATGSVYFKNLTPTNGGSVTLTATWTANTYTVNYYGNGGTPSATSKSVTYDSAYGTLATASRTGYTQSGWIYGTPRGNKTLTAGSSSNYTFDNAFGALALGKTYTITFGKATLTAHSTNNPTKFSIFIYDFDANAARLSTQLAFGSNLSWTFTVPSSGTSATNTKIIYYAGIAGATANNTVAFEDINLFNHSSTITDSTTYKTAGNSALLATWTANTYTVGYNYAGGTNGSSSPTSWTYDAAQAVSAPMRAGYVFAGWTVTSGLDASTAKWGLTVAPVTAIQSASTVCFNSATADVYFKNLTPTNGGKVTLTATWTAGQYVLSYNANGGSVSSASKNVSFDAAYGTLTTPTRTGYTFSGWSLVPNGYTQVQYIQTSGGGYVLTDIVPKSTSSLRMVEAQTSLSGTQTYWVARGASNLQDRTFTLFFINSKLRFDYNTTEGAENFAPAVNTQYVISAERNRLWVKNGNALTQTHAMNTGSFTAGGPLIFMSSYSGGTGANITNKASMKLYEVTVWDAGTAVAYLVPCYRDSDDAAGLYDVIGNKFYPGSGTVTAGDAAYVQSGTVFAASKNTTVYARWKAKTYTVALNDNFATDTGNTAGSGKVTATYDQKLPSVKAPAKNGFSFLGYYYGDTQYINASGAPARVWQIDSAVTLTGKWTINALTLTATADFSCEYNVGTKTLTATATHGCAEIAYTYAWEYGNAHTASITVPTDLDVGTYDYKIEVYGTVGAYVTATASKTVRVTIVRKNISSNGYIVASYGTFVYNGEAREGLLLLQDSQGKSTVDMVKGSDYSVAYANNTNAGTAEVTITGLGNYSGTKTGSFSITPKPLTVSTIEVNPIEAVTYKGSAYTPVVTVRSTAAPTAILTLKEGSNAGDYTVSYSRNVNAGTASITITGQGNYGDTKTVNFTIRKASLTVTAEDKTTTYGEDAPAFTATITGFVGSDTKASLFDNSDLRNGYRCEYSRGYNAGTYEIEPTQGSLAASNYDFVFVSGVLTVEKRALTVTVNDAACVYGDPIPTYEISCSALYGTDTKESVLGGKYRVSGDYAQGSGAGVYTIEVTTDELLNYRVTAHNAGVLTVAKKVLTFTATDYTIEYDQAAPVYTGTYEGFFGTDTESVVSGTPVFMCEYVKGDDSGRYTIAVDVSGLGAENYSFVGVNGVLTVNKGVLAFTFELITENGYDYVYNGRSKEVRATLKSGISSSDVLTGFTLRYYRQYVTDGGVTYTLDDLHKDAGVYKVVPDDLIINGSTETQYEVSEDSYCMMEVFKLQVVVLIEEKTVEYDGEPHGTNVSFTLGEGDRLSSTFTLLYNGYTALPVNVGKYRVTILERDTANIVFEVGNQDNYEAFRYDNGTKYVEITKKAATVTPVAINTIYGVAGTPGFTTEGILAKDGEPSCYYTYDGSRTMPTALGSYEIGVRILSGDPILGNYDVTYGTNTLTISKRRLTLTANDVTRTFNGLSFDGTVTIGGDGILTAGTDHTPTGDRIVPVFTYDGSYEAIDAGTYVIHIHSASVIGGDNSVRDYYEFDSFTDGVMTIEKAPVTLTMTSEVVFNGRVRVYSTGDGSDGEPVWAYSTGLKGSDAFGTAEFAYYDENGEPCNVVNVGAYTVHITDFTLTSGNKNNYYVESGNLTVTPLSPVITVLSREETFNATPYFATADYTLGEGDAITYEYVYKKGAVNTKTGAEEAGEWTVEVDLSTVVLTSGTPGNYGTFTFVAGTLMINRRELIVTVGTQTTTYNGQEQGVTAEVRGWAENGERPTAQFSFTYYKDNTETAPILVGTYDVTIATAVVLPVEQQANYYFTLDTEGKLVIADRELSFSVDPTASAGTFTYDGRAKRPLDSKIVIGGQGLVEGDTIEYVYNFRRSGGEWQASAIYAGEWEVVLVDVTFPGQDSHYSITGDLSAINFSIYIAPRDMTVSVRNKEEAFDGRDKVGEAVGDTLVDGDEIVCDFEYPEGRKNVGVYPVIMSNVAVYHNGNNISNSYNLTVLPNGTITVLKCAFTVTVEDVPSGTEGYVYDGTVKAGKVTSNIGVEDTFTYSLSYRRANGTETDHTDAGEWRVYIDSVAFGPGVDLNNYEDTVYVVLSSGGRFVAGTQGSAYSTMIIDPRPVTVTIEDARVTYDGNAHSLNAEYTGLVGGQTFSVGLLYSTDGETWTNEAVHAGAYTVKPDGTPTSLTYNVNNYVFDCSDRAELIIEQRVIELGITTPGRPVVPFINTPYTLNVIVPDTPDHVLVYATLLYSKDGKTPTLSPAKDIGSWEVTIGAAEIKDATGETDEAVIALWNRDYALNKSAKVQFEIGKVKIMLSNVRPVSVYNGMEQMPQIVSDPLLSEDDELVITYRVTLGGALVTPKDAGTYLITLENVEYRYHGSESTDHSEWYDFGYTQDYLRNYGEAGAWEFKIEKKAVSVTVNGIAAGTEGYVFNNQVHTTTANAPGVSPNDFRYTLMYSRSDRVGSGVWVMQDIDQKWKVVNFESMLAGDLAADEYIPISAGVWNIAVKEVRANSNYDFLYDNTVIAGTMTIDKRRTNLLVGGLDIEYDGEYHSVSITASPKMLAGDTVSAELEYCLKSVFDADPTGATWVSRIKAVGDYYVRIKENTAHSNVSSGSVENYEFIYPEVDAYGSLGITKRRITFTLEDYTGTFNGQQHYPIVVVNRLLDEDASLVRVVIDRFSFEGDNVNVNDGNCFSKVELAHLDAIGSLTAEQFAYICNNYQMNYEKGDVNEGRITIVPATITFTMESKTATYNGQEQTLEPVVWGIVPGDVVTTYLSYSDNVNVGTCTVSITGAAVTTGLRYNYVFADFSDVRGEIIITPYAVNVSLADTTAVYNGSEKQLVVSLDKALFNGDEAYLKQRIRYVRGNVTRYNPTDVGVWQGTVENVWLEKDEKTNGNYDFYFRNVSGVLTIQKARYDFTDFVAYLEAKSYTFTAEYNGHDQTPDFGNELPQGADSHLYTLRAEFSGAVKEVGDGQKALNVTFRTYNIEGEAADSPNYERPTEEYTVYFSLTAKALPVIWSPIRKRTDGQEFVAVEYSGRNSKPNASVEGENGIITLRVEVTGIDYGRVSDTPYHAVAMFEEGSAEALNYTLIGDRTEFFVVKKSVGVQFFGYSGLVYNGLEQEIQVKIEDGGLVGDDRLPLVIRYDRMVRDAGTYTATVSVDEEQAGDTFGNYELDGSVTISFSIGKKDAVIIAGNLSSVYGSPLVSLNGKYSADGFTANDQKTLSVTLTKESGNDVGSYRIVPSAEMLNYNITFVSGEYTIRPKEITVILHDQIQNDPLSSDLSQQRGIAWDVKDANAIVGNDRLNIALSTTVDLNDPNVKYGMIRASYSNPNYQVTFVGDAGEDGVHAPYAKFVITKTQAVLSLKEDFVQAYPNASKVYDGKSVRIRVENSGNGAVSYIVNGVASDNVLVEPGVYNVVVKGTAKAQFYPPEDLRYTFTIYPNEIKTEFGSYVATVRDENGYSTAASFTMVEDKASESDVQNAFSFIDNSATKQISDYYRIESDGSLSGVMQLNLSAFYKDGQEVTLYIQKHNGEYVVETHVVEDGSVILNNVEEIAGIGFVQDNNGPGFLTIVLFIAGGVLLLALFLLPAMKRRR